MTNKKPKQEFTGYVRGTVKRWSEGPAFRIWDRLTQPTIIIPPPAGVTSDDWSGKN